MKIKYSKEVAGAIKLNVPILALESTILTHGMPYPASLHLAKEMVRLCRDGNVVPALIAVVKGTPTIGLDDKQLEKLLQQKKLHKISKRELGVAMSKGWSGGTTVSSTMFLSSHANIKTFSTGGIGGVHFGFSKTFDISQDLFSLSETPQIVISAGIKAVLDIPKTCELLETLGVTVLGYKTNEVPTFYSRSSGIKNLIEVNSVSEIVSSFNFNLDLGLKSATLVFNPIPTADEIPKNEIDLFVEKAQKQLRKENISGKHITPFLLDYVLKKTGGRSLEANISLAVNNVKLGVKIAKGLTS